MSSINRLEEIFRKEAWINPPLLEIVSLVQKIKPNEPIVDEWQQRIGRDFNEIFASVLAKYGYQKKSDLIFEKTSSSFIGPEILKVTTTKLSRWTLASHIGDRFCYFQVFEKEPALRFELALLAPAVTGHQPSSLGTIPVSVFKHHLFVFLEHDGVKKLMKVFSEKRKIG